MSNRAGRRRRQKRHKRNRARRRWRDAIFRAACAFADVQRMMDDYEPEWLRQLCIAKDGPP